MAESGSLSGKAGSFKLGATAFPILSWDANFDSDLLEATNTKSSGNKQIVAGISSATGTITFQYDPNDNAIASMVPGTYLSTVNLQFDTVGGQGLSNVELNVKSFGPSLTVGGMIECTFNWESNGWDYAADLASL